MTNREKFLSVLHYGSSAQLPVVHFGFWKETVEKWIGEGHIKEGDSVDAIAEKLGFDFEFVACYSGAMNLHPVFEEKVLKELPDGSLHVLNSEGVIELRKPGIRSIPAEIGHTLTDRKSWEQEYLPRLQFSEDRVDFELLKQYTSGGDYPIGFSCGSLYGIIRNWFGIGSKTRS